MTLLIRNIGQLVLAESTPKSRVAGEEMATLPTLSNAYLHLEDERISAFGPMAECPDLPGANVIDATDRLVMPSYVDSHTHLVFPAWREGEFVDKIKGLSYAEIAAKGGGILNSAGTLATTSEDELVERALPRLKEVIGFGTGAIEIKSGYGLSVEGELKMLRAIRKLREHSPIPIKATFLGAHAIPKNYSDRRQYIDLIIREMIPQVAEEGLADYCDVFCETGFFTQAETEEICGVGLEYGLKPKIHANQLNLSGGVQAGVNLGAVSVDHLETMSEAEIVALQGSGVIGTMLPGCSFFLRMQYPPARELINAGIPVALATDYNPGSAPLGKMPLVVSLACIQMRMTPEEAFWAATLNGAAALELSHELGSIAVGKRANLYITKAIPSYAHIPYAFGGDAIDTIILNGKVYTPEE